MTSVINAAHTSDARVVLTVQCFAWSTSGRHPAEGAPRQLDRPGQPRQPDRRRGPRPRRRRRQPRLRAARLGLRRGVHGARAQGPRSTLDATAKGYQLTFDTTGWIGNYPIKDATAAGGADAIMVMGYDYRTSGASRRPARSRRSTRRSTTSTTPCKPYLAQVPASKVILGVPYYGRAWSTKTSSLHSTNISGAKYGASATAVYTTARRLAADHGRKYDADRGRVPGRPTSARRARRPTAA